VKITAPSQLLFRNDDEEAELDDGDHQAVQFAEEYRRGLHADVDVVVTIDHGVHRVVGDGP
jgi:hypothetical protein